MICKDRHASKERVSERARKVDCIDTARRFSLVRDYWPFSLKYNEDKATEISPHRSITAEDKNTRVDCLSLPHSFFPSCYYNFSRCLDGNQRRPCVASYVVMMLCCCFTLEMRVNVYIAETYPYMTTNNAKCENSARGTSREKQSRDTRARRGISWPLCYYCYETLSIRMITRLALVYMTVREGKKPNSIQWQRRRRRRRRRISFDDCEIRWCCWLLLTSMQVNERTKERARSIIQPCLQVSHCHCHDRNPIVMLTRD